MGCIIRHRRLWQPFFAALLLLIWSAQSFTITSQYTRPRTLVFSSASDEEMVARRIVVQGDVQGGYYRSCVLNEAGKFRRLVGTMSPPDESSDTAEIYVEGKKHLVEGFVRWCQRGSSAVGLNQQITVQQVLEEEPTGMYDGFYAKTQ